MLTLKEVMDTSENASIDLIKRLFVSSLEDREVNHSSWPGPSVYWALTQSCHYCHYPYNADR